MDPQNPATPPENQPGDSAPTPSEPPVPESPSPESSADLFPDPPSLEDIAHTGNVDQLEAHLSALNPADLLSEFASLDSDDQARVLAVLAPRHAGQLLGQLPDSQAADALSELDPEDAAAVLDSLDSRGRADLIANLTSHQAKAVLRQMRVPLAKEARSLAKFRPNEAGGIMATEFLSCLETATIGEVLNSLRESFEQFTDLDVQYIYCTSEFGDLVGVLRLRDLIMRRPDTIVSDVMIRQPLAVTAHTRLDEIDDLLNQSRFLGLPVVDSGRQLVGIVRRRDVEEALAKRAERDLLKIRGIWGGEELRSMPLFKRARRRLSWLTINIALNLISATAISMYQDTLAQVIALAVFLPIISDMSGCSGNQAVAVSLRELTLGVIRPRDLLRVWTKEVSIGVINGIAVGLLLAFVAFIWKSNPWLGAVVGFALAVNTVIAVSVGGLLPLVLKKLRMDPALSSAPILTTVTDFCGFFLALSFAHLALPYLITP